MFYRSGDHRDLHVLTHSFPTRLSSDRDYKAPVTQTLDLGETAAVLPENVIPWPGSLPEQVSAVQSILSAAGTPLAPQDVARAFKGKRAATVRPVLDALAGIGLARGLMDGRYAGKIFAREFPVRSFQAL